MKLTRLNLPNKLTLLRVVMIPAFLALYLGLPFGERASRLAALAVFAAASFTDWLDGYIARSQNLVTNFGKLMDPLADKMLVAAAFVAMTQTGELPAWAVIIIISREFLITGFRMLALEQSIVIHASSLGKAKTVSQMALIIAALSTLIPPQAVYILMIAAVALTVASAVEYLWKNRGIV
ncbi:MAG: CDP-diacylglycerol--glycerol-3-phosphate 3-phosphatidyltransferase [Clostridiales bacterium]|jgi:CDP-diacylglycerol--glycerol-3-phosphate 3-phosphatidyltransferase|nr:CDP-diacylglycerol--glycerol-3-phosphate 3-phosphatidyltransferase [Clostridiales bacterium]